MSTKSILRNGNIYFIIAGLTLISLIGDLRLYFLGRGAIWVILVNIFLFLSFLLTGIKEKRALVVNCKSHETEDKVKKTPLTIMVMLILFFILVQRI